MTASLCPVAALFVRADSVYKTQPGVLSVNGRPEHRAARIRKLYR